ncbi:MAG TPA: shikimate dehydrogenase [Pirellulales bacterium]|jgi:shikimate dehydrogenase|nr:shikimate dehydrogenase [Pirellulales bacterium]
MHSPLQEIVALLGYPVAGNPTQYMVERAFSRLGLDWRYLTLEVAPENLAEAVRGMRSMGFRGGNFTMPHKVAVLPLLDQLTEAARLMGAVNCWWRQDHRLVGDNTDGKGFLQSLRSRIDPAGRRFALLGAGGAARAIAVELAIAGAAQILVVNRDPGRGEQLASLVSEQVRVPARYVAWHGDFSLPSEIEVLINATSIGMGDAQARVPVALDSLRPGLIVADVVVSPPNTRLLREAAQQGCQTLDGLGMLINQAAIGFRIWTGLDCDTTAMREAAEEFLGI